MNQRLIRPESCSYLTIPNIVGIISIKAARTGFHLSKKIIHLCEQAGIRNLTGQQADSSVAILANAHLCAAFKNTSFYYPSENSFFLIPVNDLLKESIVIKDGCLELSDAPGLGIQISEKTLEKFTML